MPRYHMTSPTERTFPSSLPKVEKDQDGTERVVLRSRFAPGDVIEVPEREDGTDPLAALGVNLANHFAPVAGPSPAKAPKSPPPAPAPAAEPSTPSEEDKN